MLVNNGNLPGFEVEASFRVTLVRMRGSRVRFRTDRGGPGSVTLDVANLNVESAPRGVDRFSTGERTATFASNTAELRAGGPLEVSSVGPRLVLAHYYPWFDRSTWTSPLLADRPQQGPRPRSPPMCSGCSRPLRKQGSTASSCRGRASSSRADGITAGCRWRSRPRGRRTFAWPHCWRPPSPTLSMTRPGRTPTPAPCRRG